METRARDQEITDILKNPALHMWEDASESFCLLKYAALFRKKVILLLDKTSSDAEASYARRFIGSLGDIDCEIFEVYFHASGSLIPGSDPRPLLVEAEKGNTIFLKYKSRSNKVVLGSYNKHFDFLNRISTDLYLPNFRERCEEMFLYYSTNIDKLLKITALLSDDISKATLQEIVRVFATNGIYTLKEYTRVTKYFDCYRHKDDELWVNCGSCDGDTIFNYFSAGYGFTKILAIEGNKDAFGRLEKNMSRLPEETKRKIRTLNYFIGGDNDENTFDRLFAHVPVSLINMDIEGFEMPVLRGAQDIIKKYRPVLAVCAYHVPSDLYEIPAFINGIVDGYSFYLRKYCGFEGNAFNEFVYYCVPEERRLERAE